MQTSGAAMARAGRRNRARIVEVGAPTRERLDKADGHVDRGDHGIYTMRDTPLERLLSRDKITNHQYLSGQKYRHHWYHAGLSDALQSLDVNRIFASDLAGFSGMAKTESQVFHRQRYREGVQATGKIGAGVLDWVVCREVPLEDVGYTLGWGSKPQATAAATERLRMALDDLRKLWGI